MVLGSGKNHHEVSPEYKDLGFLHKDGRDEKYCEQDGVHDFTNMPTIFRQKRKTFAGFKTKAYDYSDKTNKLLDIQPRSNPLEKLQNTMTFAPKKPINNTNGHLGHNNTRTNSKLK